MSKEILTVEKIIKNAKQIEEDALYSEKSNFVNANFLGILNGFFTCLIIILSVIIIAFIFIQLNDFNYYLISILNFIVIILTIIQYVYNPSEKANLSRNMAREYNKLRKDVEIFYNLEINVNSTKENIDALKEFNTRKHKLDCKLPNIYGCIYKKAKRSIEKGEHEYND